MRKLVLSVATMSIDGIIAQENTEFWRRFGPASMGDDEEYDEYFTDGIRHAGVHVMGRVTYEAMADTWPYSSDPIAAIMNDTPKVVFSRTLTEARWPQARIASGNLANELTRLKAEDGGEIVAHGGAHFMQSLVRTGLVDEYRLCVYPVVVGRGMALFSGIEHPLGVKVLSSRLFTCGATVVHARPLTADELAERPVGPDTGLESQRLRDTELDAKRAAM